ncbi:MAG: pyridoxamine 5'-phosphate oxidase family protein [Chitinophagales bacterium]|nr:pyridoxamine 5'-phosphate oxidase family protein [Chitinophagaceae bacterium]MCB9063562.1 pyridoxamine 5'-phosphate oxidase family protein [Chitinophagales bacterium]
MNNTERSTVKRLAKRGQYDEETIYNILDKHCLCHVAFSVDGQPFIIPTLFGREGNIIYMHGAIANRMLTHAAQGIELCISVANINALVLARSAFHHSANYESVVLFGKGRLIEDAEEKNHALLVVSEQVLKGRWDETRPPNEKELKATKVVAFTIEEASAKVRAEGVNDDTEDYALDHWAGLLPINTTYGEPIADDRLNEDIDIPNSIKSVL